MTERSISVVVPVYEEGENIGPCLRGLWRVLSDHEHEILICYDFEEDPTLAAIEAMPDLTIPPEDYPPLLRREGPPAR